jgi:hypothetical protein
MKRSESATWRSADESISQASSRHPGSEAVSTFLGRGREKQRTASSLARSSRSRPRAAAARASPPTRRILRTRLPPSFRRRRRHPRWHLRWWHFTASIDPSDNWPRTIWPSGSSSSRARRCGTWRRWHGQHAYIARHVIDTHVKAWFLTLNGIPRVAQSPSCSTRVSMVPSVRAGTAPEPPTTPPGSQRQGE